MTSTQILAIGAPWIIALVGFIAYLVWPKSPDRSAARAEAMSAIDKGRMVGTAQPVTYTHTQAYPARMVSSAPAKPQKAPEKVSP